MRTLRIGAPRYMCTRPLLFGLMRTPDKDAELIYAESGTLSSMLEAGKVDAALVPSIEYLRGVGEGLVKGPALIANNKPGNIMLESSVEIEQIKRIAVDEFCRTPIAVLRIVLDGLFHIMPDICVAKDVDSHWQERYDAILFHNDTALHRTYQKNARPAEIADVTEMWYSLTSRPLVMAVWAFNDADMEGYFSKVLVSSRNLGMQNLSLLSDGIAQTSRFGSEFLSRYLSKNWSYQMNALEINGLKLLEDYALRYRLLRYRRPVENALIGGQ